MSYQSALEAAGATVLAFEQFGSYQGDWLAKVVYNGETGYVAGSYGSCSGCDAFEGEFGYDEREECQEHRYMDNGEPCAECSAMKEAYQTKLAAFGRDYLTLVSKEELQKQFGKQSEWDMGSEDVLKWLEQN
jgi:hypothetical protein